MAAKNSFMGTQFAIEIEQPLGQLPLDYPRSNDCLLPYSMPKATKQRRLLMRIITYNLRAGGSGHVHWSKVIDEFDPDVFLVQESYAPERHLPPLLHGQRHREASWRPVAGRKWGSAVCVKGGFTRPLELPDFHGHVVGVESIFPSAKVIHSASFRFTLHSEAATIRLFIPSLT